AVLHDHRAERRLPGGDALLRLFDRQPHEVFVGHVRMSSVVRCPLGASCGHTLRAARRPSVRQRNTSSLVAGSRKVCPQDAHASACFTAAHTDTPKSSGGSPTALLRYTFIVFARLSRNSTRNSAGTSVTLGTL